MVGKHKNGIFLYEYYLEKIHFFIAGLAKAKTNITAETIHALRVDIKKIRSFYVFLEMITRKKFSKDNHYEIFRELFTNAGKIRELQVSIDLFCKYISPLNDINGFRKFSEGELVKSVNQFKLSSRNFRLKELNLFEVEILDFCSNIKHDSIVKKCEKFISTELNKIRKIYLNEKSLNKFHKIRKHLRALREVMDLLLLFVNNRKIKNKRKDLKSTEDLLGTWHDHLILFNLISSFIKRNTVQINRSEELRKLMAQIKKDSEACLAKEKFRAFRKN